ncbi:MAG: hypothetical protein A2Y77_11955 [Planctomycetes bacterium RBG_13_62_9]|nr:MAG: hypothetical protein A2Y77_11955 [Planctomycetes bacterium RBG_13_62_9]
MTKTLSPIRGPVLDFGISAFRACFGFRTSNFGFLRHFRASDFGCQVSCFLALAVLLGGCVSDKVGDGTALTAYQQMLAEQGPQQRQSTEADDPCNVLGVLQPVQTEDRPIPDLEITTDPNTGHKTVALTIEQAITRALANSPEIRVVSFDPEIARQEITKAAAEFDPTAFSRVFYEDQNSPENSIFESGEAQSRLFESGLRQKIPQGTEWSASYALSRNWDDLFGRTLPTRYEPMLIFQLRQPLWRGASLELNLGGVNVAKLEYEVALVTFRDKAESIAGQAIAAYWRLVQTLRDLEVQNELVEQTLETLRKVESRREIDATDVQLMQAKASTKVRQADLLTMQKQVADAQDALARLMADPQVNTITELTIAPVTAPEIWKEPPDPAKMSENALATAMRSNPVVHEAQLRVKVADINMRVAENQKMPRVDLIASVRAQGIADNIPDAHGSLEADDYRTYGIGVTLEYPLGNRQREAEHTRRRLERRKAVSMLHNAADQVAAQVKEKARKVHTTLTQIGIQKDASQAAQTQLKAIEESEPVRERLTPEFLLVKLQAQETYAQTRRAETSAIVEFNIAQAELARVTGTVLKMHRVEDSLAKITPSPED